jgi:very-short-patch-repair endonuclease
LRRWRFDWAFIDAKLAVEVDGGAWTGGRHTRGRGYKADIEKIAAAMCQGWVVLRVMPEHVESGEAVTWCEKILAWRQG